MSQERAKDEIATFIATENIFNDATNGRTGGSKWMRKAVGWRATPTALLVCHDEMAEGKGRTDGRTTYAERERETER